jgi:hypothetical protein
MDPQNLVKRFQSSSFRITGTLFTVTPIVLGAIAFIDLSTIFGIGALSAISLLGKFLYNYLISASKRFFFSTTNRDDEISALKSTLNNLKVELYKLSNNEATTGVSEEELNATIRGSITQQLESAGFVELLESKFGHQIYEEARIHKLNKDFIGIAQRINSEIERLTKSANLNLVFGSISTMAAIGFLGFEVLYRGTNFTELVPLLSYYIPRIAIVIFVEVFAFFFLKIYRTNLNDIKYFHNEKTNIDLKLIAIKSAIATKDVAIIKLAIEEFVRTERNFILRKDESTIELEKSKIDSNNSQSVLNAFKDVLKVNGTNNRSSD